MSTIVESRYNLRPRVVPRLHSSGCHKAKAKTKAKPKHTHTVCYATNLHKMAERNYDSTQITVDSEAGTWDKDKAVMLIYSKVGVATIPIPFTPPFVLLHGKDGQCVVIMDHREN